MLIVQDDRARVTARANGKISLELCVKNDTWETVATGSTGYILGMVARDGQELKKDLWIDSTKIRLALLRWRTENG